MALAEALHSLWKAKVEGDEFFSQETPGGGEGDEAQRLMRCGAHCLRPAAE